MAGTDLVQRTQQTIQLLDHPQFVDQVEALLPETVPMRRFVQVAKTAIRSNPDLAAADQTSLFGAIIRCAQDGLYPDKHEAVLNVYGGKVTYLPMVAGVIRAARDFGWLMHADVVHENDTFEWRGSDEKPYHRHPRPGEPRGELVATFAYATRGSETMSVVLYADDVAKRRAKAQTDKVWKEWPEAMWRKSSAHALYRKLPKSERDRHDRFDDVEPDTTAAELLYGPDDQAFTAIAASPSEDGNTRQAEPDPPLSGSAPGGPDEDEDPEPQPAAKIDYGETVVPNGAYADMTLTQVAALGEDGEKWLTWAHRNQARFDDDFATALVRFMDEQLKAAAA